MMRALLAAAFLIAMVIMPHVNASLQLYEQASWNGVAFYTVLDDLDGDGIRDIVAAPRHYSPENQVSAWKGDGTALQGWPLSANDMVYSLSVGDMNTDGVPEVVFGDASGMMYAYNPNGSLAWSAGNCYMNGSVEFPPALADITGDGRHEAIFPCFNISHSRSYIEVIDWRGSAVHGWGYMIPAEIRGAAVAADIDADGTAEIFAAFEDSQPFIEAFYWNGTAIWRRNLGNNSFRFEFGGESPAVGDIDSDGEYEIVTKVFYRNKAIIFIIEADGSVSGEWSVNASLSSPIVLGDIDGDGISEIIAHLDNTLYAWEGNGSLVWSFHLGMPSSPISPVITDIDGKGNPEIVVPSENTLYIISSEGKEIWKREFSGRWDYSVFAPAAGNVDSDAETEIVFGEKEYAGNYLIDANVHVLEAKEVCDLSIDIQSPLNQSYYARDVPLRILTGKDAAGITYSLNGGANITMHGETSIMASLGYNTLDVWVSGCGTENHTNVHFVVSDVENPATRTNYSNNGTWVAWPQSIMLIEKDNMDDPITLFCTDSNGTCTPDTEVDNSSVIHVTKEGITHLRFNSTDSSGNSVVFEEVVMIDMHNPVVYAMSPPNGSVWNSSGAVEFLYNVSDNTTVTCTLLVDGQDSGTGNNGSFLKTLDNGNHTWFVSCRDSAGRVGDSGVMVIVVDYRRPPQKKKESGSGGGGSGGGSGGAYPAPEHHTHYWSIIEPGEAAVMETGEDDGIREIVLLVREVSRGVSLSVRSLESVPEGLKEAPGDIYGYFEIAAKGMENLEHGIIRFCTDSEWSDGKEIAMMRFSGSWERLPTEETGNGTDYSCYKAQTPGFSYFAITGNVLEKPAEPQPKSEYIANSTSRTEHDARVPEESSHAPAGMASAKQPGINYQTIAEWLVASAAASALLLGKRIKRLLRF